MIGQTVAKGSLSLTRCGSNENIVETLSKKSSGFYYYHLDSAEYSNLTIYDCGYEKFSDHLKVIRDKYPFYLMHYVLSGKGTVKFSEKEFKVHGGDIFLIPEGVETEYFQDVSDPWSYIYINFNGSAAIQFRNKAGFSEVSPCYNSGNSEIQNKFFKLVNAKIQQKHIFYIYSVLFDIMASIIKERRPKSNDTTTLGSEYLTAALKYIEKNYYRSDLSLQNIAAEQHLNPSYFSRLFHRITGTPFLKFLTMFRIQKSTTLLTDSNLSIKEIANSVGFEDPLYFSTIFKKYRLMSPGEYRQKNSLKKEDSATPPPDFK